MGAELGKGVEEVGKTSRVSGFDARAVSLCLTFSLDSASRIGTATSETRYLFAVHKCARGDFDRPRIGHLPGPDQGGPKERSKGLDQERGYKGGNSVAVNQPWTDGVARPQRDGKSIALPR